MGFFRVAPGISLVVLETSLVRAPVLYHGTTLLSGGFCVDGSTPQPLLNFCRKVQALWYVFRAILKSVKILTLLEIYTEENVW